MSCPTCGLRQWSYDTTTLTCKNGHRFPADAPSSVERCLPLWAAPASFVAGFALDFLLHSIT